MNIYEIEDVSATNLVGAINPNDGEYERNIFDAAHRLYRGGKGNAQYVTQILSSGTTHWMLNGEEFTVNSLFPIHPDIDAINARIAFENAMQDLHDFGNGQDFSLTVCPIYDNDGVEWAATIKYTNPNGVEEATDYRSFDNAWEAITDAVNQYKEGLS